MILNKPSFFQNRLQESLNLFGAVVNNKFFTDTSMVSCNIKQSPYKILKNTDLLSLCEYDVETSYKIVLVCIFVK